MAPLTALAHCGFKLSGVMTSADTIRKEEPSSLALRGMVHIPGGVFRMGSDVHYPEESPSHLVKVDGFWIDRYPVTNREFRKFVNATRYVTFAEIAPDPKNYPGALPHMLKAGSLVFTPPKHPVDLRELHGRFARGTQPAGHQDQGQWAPEWSKERRDSIWGRAARPSAQEPVLHW
jgi:formylglycine-generating enzyme required for sulfatase activity